jgi:hypothetical protein
MRDDIHRRLPIPSVWRRVVRFCARDADETRRPGAVTAALATHARQLGGTFLRNLRTGLEASRTNLFPSEVVARSAHPRNAAEDQLMRHCELHANDRRDSGEILRDGVLDFLTAQGDAQVREIAGHLQLEARQDAGELLARLEDACAQVDVIALAAEVVSGECPARAPNAAFDLDDDLRAP